jgi:branched-chain amino acid transport system permease protein
MNGQLGDRVMTSARMGFAIALGVLALAGVGHRADAQEEEAAQSVGGRVQNRFEEDGERVSEPVPGVRLVVETESGEVVGEGVTDESGNYRIGIPEPGTYVVRIDEESLPEDLGVAEGAGEQQVTVSANGRETRAFFLGERVRDIKGKWELLPQTLANGLKLAMIIAITSMGLSLIYGTTGLSNFAHGEMVTFGAIMVWVFNREFGLHIIPAAAAGVVVSSALGIVLEGGLFRPLRSHKTSLTSTMIVTIGMALAARYVYVYFFGAGIEAYKQYTTQSVVDIGPVALTPRSMTVMGLSAAVIVAIAVFLIKARFGKAIRAVSDNPDLASSTGIDTNRVILIVWALGGALAGLGGVFYGLDFGVKWDMGFTLLLMMFAAITLGGLGNPFGALLGSLVIGIFVEMWTWIVPNANDLKSVGALFALIVILLVRPQGLLGSKERIG